MHILSFQIILVVVETEKIPLIYFRGFKSDGIRKATTMLSAFTNGEGIALETKKKKQNKCRHSKFSRKLMLCLYLEPIAVLHCKCVEISIQVAYQWVSLLKARKFHRNLQMNAGRWEGVGKAWFWGEIYLWVSCRMCLWNGTCVARGDISVPSNRIQMIEVRLVLIEYRWPGSSGRASSPSGDVTQLGRKCKSQWKIQNTKIPKAKYKIQMTRLISL